MKQVDLTTAKVQDPSQLLLVSSFMSDGRWHTIPQIAEHLRCPEASISARLRDLRKPKYGAHTINRRYVAQGLFAYQYVENPSA